MGEDKQVDYIEQAQCDLQNGSYFDDRCEYEHAMPCYQRAIVAALIAIAQELRALNAEMFGLTE